MNKPNRPPKIDTQETPVAMRFSFANDGLMRRDTIHRQAPGSVRTITYRTPPDRARSLRQILSDRGLVLGQLSEDEGDGLERFIIPSSARPISQDVATNSSGDFTYNDALLFFDLGKLLGALAEEGPELPLMLTDAVGHNIATKAFTRPDEPKIWLVPGFELSVHEVENDDTAIDRYLDNLREEFGVRLEPHSGHFIEGFRAALG